jgi:hypothetical protein
MKQLGLDGSISNVYDNYLRPLNKQGIIDYSKSVLNGKEKLYYPANNNSDTDNRLSSSLLPLTEDCRLILNKPCDEKNVLEESFITIIEQRSNEGVVNNKYKIIDIDGSEISISELLEKYYFNSNHYHTACSVILQKSYNNSIEHYSIIDAQTKANEILDVEISANRAVIDSSTTNTISINSSVYRFTKENIDNFFASNTGQASEHTLEESICRPSIDSTITNHFYITVS